MGAFATPWWGQVLAWLTAAIIVALNGKLVLGPDRRVGRRWRPSRGSGSGPFPLSWLVAAGAVRPGRRGAGAAGLGDAQALAPPLAGLDAPSRASQLDWVDTLRPRPLATIGVALEHNPADAEILNRALSLAQPGQSLLVLLHVVDTPMTRVYGAETADRETGADERYLAEVVRVLRRAGLPAALGPALRPRPRRRAGRATCGAIRSTCWSSARTATAWSATCSWARPWTGSATAWRSRC